VTVTHWGTLGGRGWTPVHPALTRSVKGRRPPSKISGWSPSSSVPPHLQHCICVYSLSFHSSFTHANWCSSRLRAWTSPTLFALYTTTLGYILTATNVFYHFYAFYSQLCISCENTTGDNSHSILLSILESFVCDSSLAPFC